MLQKKLNTPGKNRDPENPGGTIEKPAKIRVRKAQNQNKLDSEKIPSDPNSLRVSPCQNLRRARTEWYSRTSIEADRLP